MDADETRAAGESGLPADPSHSADTGHVEETVELTANAVTAATAAASSAASSSGSESSGSEPTEEIPRVRATQPPYRPSILAKVFRVTGRTAVALLSVVVLGGTAYAWSTEQQLSDGLHTTNVISPSVVEPTTDVSNGLGTTVSTEQDILLVGMDSRTDAQGNPLPAAEFDMLHAGPDTGELDTDTMILVHIPAGGGSAVAISFPRDSYVQLANGYGKHKLNSAYAYAHNAEASKLREEGQTNSAQIEVQADDAGRAELIATIEQLIGNAVTINRYAEINLLGFYDISEAVGGVTVCLKQATHDDETGASFPAGVQTIEGVQALDFVRQRHGLLRGDLDRIVRQQVFMGALAKKILSAGVLTNPSKLDNLISAIQSSVTVSSGWDLLDFAEELANLSSGAIQFVTIPTGENVTVASDGDVTEISTTQVREYVQSVVTNGANAAASTDTSGPNDTSSTTTPSTDTAGSGGVNATTSAPPTSTTSANSEGAVITAGGIPCVD